MAPQESELTSHLGLGFNSSIKGIQAMWGNSQIGNWERKYIRSQKKKEVVVNFFFKLCNSGDMAKELKYLEQFVK